MYLQDDLNVCKHCHYVKSENHCKILMQVKVLTLTIQFFKDYNIMFTNVSGNRNVTM